jgi:hypothetical protein
MLCESLIFVGTFYLNPLYNDVRTVHKNNWFYLLRFYKQNNENTGKVEYFTPALCLNNY